MPPKKVIRRAPVKAPPADDAANTTAATATESNNGPQATSEMSSAPAATSATTEPVASSSSTSTTAAPKPGVKRLDTLARPSIGTPSTRTGATASGTTAGRAAAKPKFVGRRSQTQRAELEKAEAERQAKEAAARARRESRFRGRGDGDRGRGRGRGRGGFMGERERLPAGASGPFSMGMVSADAGRGRMGRMGGGGGTTFGGSSSGGGGDGGRYVMQSTLIKHEGGEGDGSMGYLQDGGYISSDDDGDDKAVQRKNVDELEVIDLTNDDSNPARNFVPLRIPRHVHKERTLGLNADGAASAEATNKEEVTESGADGAAGRKSKPKTKDVEFTGEKEKYHGNWSSSSETDTETKVKQEPVDEDEQGVLPRPSTPEPGAENDRPSDQQSSPESKRKGKERATTDSPTATSKVRKPTFQTQEESDEWDRHQNDLRILYEELGTLVLPTTNAPTDADGDAVMASANAETPAAQPDRRADKVYLFQFPPILPDLAPIQVKSEPETNPDDASNDPMQLDPSRSQPVIVGDDPNKSHLPRLPTGAVGKLRIHRSGRATLDWGGTPLSMGMGTDTSFLQDILVADYADAGTKATNNEAEGVVKGEDRRGVAMGMGQVKGKFVVTPDWEAMISG
ncbi:Hypothetical protein R9X50_00233100 [Acrodontium crateriforme]|uniref:RNA polymerase III RPC4 n=1 Tax=Acrodontium crateriforme TaxID=150365 RepID=A0AAQ3M0M4_9PEZI|nr:Hypothetical protein R9X50_00233100 [Acrodontium crateriforme]